MTNSIEPLPGEKFKRYREQFTDPDDQKVLDFLLEKMHGMVAERDRFGSRLVRMEILRRHFTERRFLEKLNAVLAEMLQRDTFDLMGGLRKEWRSGGKQRFIEMRADFDMRCIDSLVQKIITSESGRDDRVTLDVFKRMRQVLMAEFLYEEVREEEDGNEGSPFAHYLKEISARIAKCEEELERNAEKQGGVVGEVRRKKSDGNDQKGRSVIYAEEKFAKGVEGKRA